MLLVGLAGCGGSSSNGSSAPKSAAAKPPTALYKLKLSGRTGTPTGASQGSGLAVIAFHGPTVVCWRFAHLHGFTGVTSARLQTGSGRHAATVFHLASGKGFHHRGCRRVHSGTLAAITRDPSRYVVSLASSAYPLGAVRGHL